jgi:hypothetical protein
MSTRSLPELPAPNRHGSLAGRIVHHAPTRPIVRGAFWAAIVLPFVHVPLLLAGVNTPGRLGGYLGLLTLNLVCLAVGHGHEGRGG